MNYIIYTDFNTTHILEVENIFDGFKELKDKYDVGEYNVLDSISEWDLPEVAEYKKKRYNISP